MPGAKGAGVRRVHLFAADPDAVGLDRQRRRGQKPHDQDKGQQQTYQRFHTSFHSLFLLFKSWILFLSFLVSPLL